MKIHYDPYGDEYADTTLCGLQIAEEYNYSESISRVTCKRCLKRAGRIRESFKSDMDTYADQLGDMAELLKDE